MNKTRSVVITGAAVSSPAGNTLEAQYAATWEGNPCFSAITRYNAAHSAVRFAGECQQVDIAKLPDKKVQKIIRRKDVIALITTINAAQNAAITSDGVNPERFGMYVGVGCTQIGDLTPYFGLVSQCADMTAKKFDSERFGREFMGLVNPLVVLQNLMNNALCFGTKTIDARGVNANFMDFEVSGIRAVGEAFRSIATDRADIVVAGGVAATIEPFHVAEGVRAGYLAITSAPDIRPEFVVKPFDAGRRGAILSEGSAFVVLEEEAHARRRGAAILGRVNGYGFSSDGRFELMKETHSPGLVTAMRRAASEARVSPENIGAILAHANGSPHGDLAEASSYREFLAEHAKMIPVASPKGVLGEMSEAAGVLGLVLGLEALRRGEIFGTRNFSGGDAMSGQLSVSAKAQKINDLHVLVTARSFVGLSACLAVSAN